MKKIFVTLLSIGLVSVSFSSASVLKRGSSGESVKALQELLAKSDVGFDATNATGYYGSLTAMAVANLQSKYGLEAVGSVGPKTAKVINILNELNKIPIANQAAVAQSIPSQIANNINNTDTTITKSRNSVTFSYVNPTTGSNGASLVSSNQTNNANNNTNNVVETRKVNQNESRGKSDDYKRIFNGNVDTRTGFVKPSFATSTNGVTKVIVRYKTKPTTDEENKIVSRGGKKKVYNLVPVISAEVADVDIDKISNDPNVLSIEKDEPISIKSDLEYANTWGVTNTGAKTVHTGGVTGQGVKIAVLDTGIDYNNSDLSANYVSGYNFIAGTTDPMDDHGHGTHVTGIVDALNNGVGVIGEAPDAKIYALKILDSAGNGYSSNVISALDWAVNNGIQVVNVSFGTPNYPGTALEDAFINAEAKGLVVVAASGNAGTCAGETDTVYYPARFASVISVGAIDSNNGHSCFSSAGPNVELSAPGSNINSTKLGGGDIVYSGTSMAAPHVAGAAADLISAGVKDLNGNGRINDEVRDILDKSALDLGMAGRDNIFGFGSVKIDNALAYLASVNVTAPAPVVATPATVVTQPVATTTTIITSPIITQPAIAPITTTPITTPTIVTQPVTTAPVISPILTPAPVVAPTPIPSTTPTIISPVIMPTPTSAPTVISPIVMPRMSDNDTLRQRLEGELENIRKGAMGDFKREENSRNNNPNSSNSNNSNRGESSRRSR